MLRPDGAHLFVRRKLASIFLRKGFFKRGLLLGGQLNRRLILSGKLQEHAGKVVLHFRGETAHGLDGVFKQFGHNLIIRQWIGGREAKTHEHFAHEFRKGKAQSDRTL
jgi:hypothetical protein